MKLDILFIMDLIDHEKNAKQICVQHSWEQLRVSLEKVRWTSERV